MLTFELFSFDYDPKNRLFGIWIGAVETDNLCRHFVSLYYMDGELQIDLFFIRVLTAYL